MSRQTWIAKRRIIPPEPNVEMNFGQWPGTLVIPAMGEWQRCRVQKTAWPGLVVVDLTLTCRPGPSLERLPCPTSLPSVTLKRAARERAEAVTAREADTVKARDGASTKLTAGPFTLGAGTRHDLDVVRSIQHEVKRTIDRHGLVES